MLVFKSDCEDLKTDWKVTMSKADWAEAKKTLYETRDEDGLLINFTNLKEASCIETENF